MDSNESTSLVCSILAMEQSGFSYKACRYCETPVPEVSPAEFICSSRKCACRLRTSKRLFRILFSIASDTRVINVVAFDRAAQAIFGCSAQEFFDFSILHPFAVKHASEVVVGELFKVTLNQPRRGKADHLRITDVVPMSSHFKPIIKMLEEIYESKAA